MLRKIFPQKVGLFVIMILICEVNLFSQITGIDRNSSNKSTFSLIECIDIALQGNPEIKMADSRIKSSEADVKNAFGYFLPQINFNSGYSRQLNAKPGFEFLNGSLVPTDPKANSYSINAGASLLIFDGFSRTSNYERAYENFNAIELNSKYVRQKIKLQVYQYYTDVIAKSQIVKIRRENLELGRKELERIEAQNKAGLIAVDIVYSQQADLGNKEFELITSENNLNVSKANLLVLMGMKPDLNSEFLESSLPNDISKNEIDGFRKEIGVFVDALNETFNSRLDYKAYQAQIKASEASVESSYSGYYPTISASGGWYWSNVEFDNFSALSRSSIGFNLHIPIFDQFTTNYRIQNAQVNLDQNKIQKTQLEQDIISSLQNAYLNLEASEKQLEISDKTLFAAMKSNESQKEKFRLGTASITEYLVTNTQFITAQINRINAVYQYFRIQKELLFLIGKLK
jgi:outer membrane protein